jgi:AGCS family alanine or glycine:cation symporter
MEAFAQFLGGLNGFLWGNVLVYLLLGAGLYFTVRTRAIQVRLFWQGVREMVSGVAHRKPGDISPFQAFATGMASRVGVGNIAGVAIAISLGGPGAVFWMWVTALAGMASSVVECTLAQLYKERQPDGTFRGGPAYYIRRGLGNGPLAALFALSLLLAFGFAFNAIQSNTIASICGQTYGWASWVVGLALVLMTAPIIGGGVRSVGVVAEFMVPVMAALYLLATLFVLAKNWSEVPAVLTLIVQSAFGFGPAAAGFAGYTLAQGMTMGVRRSLFSNEAGMGSAPNAAATAGTDHPATQGFLQMFGVFVDTIIVCSCTAFLILLSGAFVPGQEAEGVTLTQNALSSELGAWSGHFLAVMIFFFAFSSIIGNYAYAEGNVTFLKKGRFAVIVFRVLVLGMVFLGAVAKVELVWQFGDLSQALMVVINLVAILALSGTAVAVLKDFEKQRRSGAKRPVFARDRLPAVQGILADEVWPDHFCPGDLRSFPVAAEHSDRDGRPMNL